MTLNIALVGRPNVGKSSLFNRLARRKLAIVDDTPGVTRDWRTVPAEISGYRINIIDTAGLEARFDESIESRMRQQTELALSQADVIIFMLDGRAGVISMDEHFADWLRRTGKPVILVLNKCENERAVMAAIAEAHGLGLGEPIPISSAHGDGMEDLTAAILSYVPEDIKDEEENFAEENSFIPEKTIDELEGSERDLLEELVSEEDAKPVRIAIVGRPNAGKSTLLNTILQDERVITGPEAGLTRDAVAVNWTYQDRWLKLVDTAGLRRKARIRGSIEKMAVDETMRAIRLAQVVILVLDSMEGLDKQDLQIASHIIEEGRALILACNKWDLVQKKDETRNDIQYRLQKSLAQVHDLPMVTLSALNGKNIDHLMTFVLETFDTWSTRTGTAKLNRWLARQEEKHPPPLVDGKPNRLRYITQIKTRPPTFVVWCGRPKMLGESYRRYIINGLRTDFDMKGIPVRLMVRTSKNPYV